MIPLPLADRGRPLEILAFNGGCTMQDRLRSLGMAPGRHLTLIDAGRGGPVLIEIDGCRVAIGASLAAKVLVR